MQFSLDCYPCAVRQALLAIRQAGMDEAAQGAAMRRILQGLIDIEVGASAPEITMQMHALLREITGVEDLYREQKTLSTKEALSLYPALKEKIQRSSDPFETALPLSIAGNIIDFGPQDSFDLAATIQRVLDQPFALNDLESLRASLAACGQVMFLADNAGETVFDRLLIETIGKPTVYVVKEAPILNDATREDALAAGLDGVAEVISCGTRSPGILLEKCSSDFLDRFWKASLIIAKGMGNYEALNTVQAPIYFLLQVKCELVGRDLAVPRGSIVVTKRDSQVSPVA